MYIVYASINSQVGSRHSEFTARKAAIKKANELVAAAFATVIIERRTPGCRSEIIFKNQIGIPKAF